MSQRAVSVLMGRLITDEDLQLLFSVDPLGVLSDWLNSGFDLTCDEIDTLLQWDVTASAVSTVVPSAWDQ